MTEMDALRVAKRKASQMSLSVPPDESPYFLK